MYPLTLPSVFCRRGRGAFTKTVFSPVEGPSPSHEESSDEPRTYTLRETSVRVKKRSFIEFDISDCEWRCCEWGVVSGGAVSGVCEWRCCEWRCCEWGVVSGGVVSGGAVSF